MPEKHPNVHADQFDAVAQSLKAHPSKAQILVEVQSQGETLEKALTVLKNTGVYPTVHRVIKKGETTWILLHLSAQDMREAVYKLTEAGFIKLKGINPLRYEPK